MKSSNNPYVRQLIQILFKQRICIQVTNIPLFKHPVVACSAFLHLRRSGEAPYFFDLFWYTFLLYSLQIRIFIMYFFHSSLLHIPVH